MPHFRGSIQEFHQIIGPRIRNKVNNLTRTERLRRNGDCEHCHQRSELESAHIHGRDRRKLIENVLMEYSHNGFVECDLSEAEYKIIQAHLPIKETFIFLCAECHRKYDSNDCVERNGRNFKVQQIDNLVTKTNDMDKIKTSRRKLIPLEGDQEELSDIKLYRCIKTIGMKCYAKYYFDFNNNSISIDEIVEKLMENEGYTEGGSRIRVSSARIILRCGRSKDALRLISQARLISQEVKDEAERLLSL
jgi:hypothetical protein